MELEDDESWGPWGSSGVLPKAPRVKPEEKKMPRRAAGPYLLPRPPKSKDDEKKNKKENEANKTNKDSHF
jgi:hypothetical protein